MCGLTIRMYSVSPCPCTMPYQIITYSHLPCLMFTCHHLQSTTTYANLPYCLTTLLLRCFHPSALATYNLAPLHMFDNQRMLSSHHYIRTSARRTQPGHWCSTFDCKVQPTSLFNTYSTLHLTKSTAFSIEAHSADTYMRSKVTPPPSTCTSHCHVHVTLPLSVQQPQPCTPHNHGPLRL